MKYLDAAGVRQFKEYNDSKYVVTEDIVDLTAGSLDFYTKAEVDSQLATKQNTLTSGTNIKTINNESILGSGNITISGSNGEENVIETVKVNGTALTPDANKAVDVTVPILLDSNGELYTSNGIGVGTIEGNDGATYAVGPANETQNTDFILATTDQIPTVNNSTITVQMNGSTVDTFTTNASSNKTINLGTVVTSETDPVFSASAAAGITSSDITN